MKVPITKPYFTEEELREIEDTLKSGWVVQGPKVKKFEELFAEYVGVKHARATSSCTTALHIGLRILGVGEEHEVIVPSFTFIATANVVEYTGASVVFCDVDLRTYNISIDSVLEIIESNYIWDGKKLINKKTKKFLKAIIPVHQFGLPADIPRLNEIARKYNLKILEDGACAIGAKINGKHVGTFGNLCAFSFHPRKSITTGEGGMIVTDSESIVREIEALRSHGATVSDLQRHLKLGFLLPEYETFGYNYRMTDIQGAIGIHQMKKLEKILRKKKELVEKYKEALKDIKGLIPPYIPEGYEHGYQSLVYRIDHKALGLTVEKANEFRNNFMKKLEENGIATRQGTHAVHMLRYYRKKYGYEPMDIPNAFILDRLTIAFPMYFTMTDGEFEYVVENIKKLWYF